MRLRLPANPRRRLSNFHGVYHRVSTFFKRLHESRREFVRASPLDRKRSRSSNPVTCRAWPRSAFTWQGEVGAVGPELVSRQSPATGRESARDLVDVPVFHGKAQAGGRTGRPVRAGRNLVSRNTAKPRDRAGMSEPGLCSRRTGRTVSSRRQPVVGTCLKNR